MEGDIIGTCRRCLPLLTSIRMKKFLPVIAASVLLSACAGSNKNDLTPSLAEDLYHLTDTVKGTVGIAFVTEGDTVTVNNGVHFPMMSVFKLHESIAVAKTMEREGTSLDSMISVAYTDLDKETWSPMLKEVGDKDFSISVSKLLEYALVSSDNNASNLLFQTIVSPSETDSIVKSLAADTGFQILYSEGEMKRNHSLSYANHTSPLSAALLIKQLFNTSLLSEKNQDTLQQYLSTVTTGQDRLGSVITDADSVFFAHKTGSGYRNENNELIAHNDVGYFRMPDGRDYSLAVFIRDFDGTEEEASRIIASISRCVFDRFLRNQ